MGTATLNKPGSLVRYRDRDWMVLPSDDPELMMIKPLGGADEETTAVYLPLNITEETVGEARFEPPAPSDLGDFETAKILFDACRLSFRNASGPFRCIGKLSFRPRSYQIVPLVMALRQKTVRLMIADDVGIGKTIEALIILKELLERGEIRRFAIICPPHLCEQWQSELKDKLDIEAEIIRTSTTAYLERKLADDRSIFHHFPFQVISIDYIKSDKRKNIFLSDCPEFVVVDEAHTCALPEGSKSRSQQQRFALLHDVARDEKRHLVMLTATPHSGKDSEFTSLLGLLKKEFAQLDFEHIDSSKRAVIAKNFIQRKRENIKRWLNQQTPFPDRDSKEIGYSLTPQYQTFYQEVLQFARGISSAEDQPSQQRMIRSWAAISLMRGVMSSPAMAIEMFRHRQEKIHQPESEDLVVPSTENTLFEKVEESDDTFRLDLLEKIDFRTEESFRLKQMLAHAEKLLSLENDAKVQTALNLIHKWLKAGFHPIVFCKYIATAHYLAQHLKAALPSKVDVQAITSELTDEERRERILLMGESKQRVLVATDCLSEGINLQEYFTAVLHYDLPWNPNRLEQREGRVDRYGQDAPLIKTYLLYGEDNPMDKFVLDVLIRKVRAIQKSIGVSITIGDENRSIMAEAADRLFRSGENQDEQLRLFAEEKISNELEKAREKGIRLRNIFAHETVDPEDIQKNLEEIDETIGDVATVENLVLNGVQYLGASITPHQQGFLLNPQNLPGHLKAHFEGKQTVRISFESPTPKGCRYIGRNHTFVEQLCQFLIALAVEGHPGFHRIARASEIQTDQVSQKTTLVMFRVRNVIKEVQTKREVVAEEMYLWGYRAVGGTTQTLEYAEAKPLLLETQSLTNLSPERQEADIAREMIRFQELEPQFVELAIARAEHLVEAHGRFKKLVGGRRYERATPVLPPDVMGVYILIPKPKAL